MAFVNDNDFETYSILWLDPNITQDDINQKVRQQLRSIVNHVKPFSSPNTFKEYVECAPKEYQLILIADEVLGRQTLPSIHNLSQVASIYIFNNKRILNDEWISSFSKIRAVCTQYEELITNIKSDQQLRMKTEEPWVIDFFTPISGCLGQSTTGLNCYFVHYQLFTDVLLRFKPSTVDANSFISLCKDNYKDNPHQIPTVKEFEQSYSSTQALQWYIRDCFFRQVLNTALRHHNVELLVLMRSYIQDIGKTLFKCQPTTPMRVYRGQLIVKTELEVMRTLVGEFISINSFMSCNSKKHLALQHAVKWDARDDLVQILFEIDADPVMNTNKPFGIITDYNEFSPENDVLFMPWSIFRLIDVLQRTVDQTWIIRMRLCNQTEKDLRPFYDYIKNENGDGDTNDYLLGKALRRLIKLDLAEKYLLLSLNAPTTSGISMGDLYCNLGLIANDKSDYAAGFKWYRKSLDFYMQTSPTDNVTIGTIHKNIGELYGKSGDRARALQSYNTAVSLFEQTFNKNDPKMADFYYSIAHVYQEEGEYLKALKFFEKSVAIQQKNLPPNHPDLSESYNSLGLVHAALGHFDLSLKYNERSLNNKLKSLSPHHPDIGISYRNIGMVYADKGKYDQALSYLRKAATVFSQSLPSEHPHILQTEQNIKRITRKMA